MNIAENPDLTTTDPKTSMWEESMMARLKTPFTRKMDAITDAMPSKATREKARLKRKKKK